MPSGGTHKNASCSSNPATVIDLFVCECIDGERSARTPFLTDGRGEQKIPLRPGGAPGRKRSNSNNPLSVKLQY